jgi:hypothetical protein
MLLNPDDFEQVWLYICERARIDQKERAFIESFAGKGENWVEAVERDEIRVRAKIPKGDGSPQPLRKSTFRREWKKLTEDGSSDNVSRQAVWDMLDRYFDDVERGPDRWPLHWTGLLGRRR